MIRRICKLAFITCLLALFASCTEDIDKSNRYTFKNETMADYLRNRPEFSDFIKIYEKAKMMGILQTYGDHTLFAPTNKAIERFLIEQDSIWQNTKDTDKPIWTGVESPYLEDLLKDDSMAIAIAKTHLIPAKYELIDITSADLLPTQNYNNRYMSMKFTVDENDIPQVYVNNQARIILGDERTENGVIHVVDQVVNQSTKMVSEHLEQYDYFSIFSEAIKLTGYEEKMQGYEDKSYDLMNVDAPGYSKANDITGAAKYPRMKYQKYTIFAPYDSVFNELGISDIEDLKAKVTTWYTDEAPNDYTNSKNALNKFVGYHLLDCEVTYPKLVLYEHNLKLDNDGEAVKGETFYSEHAFMPGFDRMDYFVTKTNQILKVIIPLSSNDVNKKYKKFLNPSNRMAPIVPGMEKHMDIMVYNPNDFPDKCPEIYGDFDSQALNGTILPIDGVLIYNEEEMRQNVLYERMRFDFASLLPELMTNDVRYSSKKATGSTFARKSFPTAGDVNIPDGYCKNLKINNPLTLLHYLTPWDWGVTLNGDEFIANGQYDFEYRLPPLPEGQYEIRIGYSATSPRSITQFYVNGKICGIPVDLRIPANDARIGWIKDSETDDNGIENDKTMRNHGYMKGPLSIANYVDHKNGENMESARHSPGGIRYIITTMHYDPNREGGNWLRMKSVVDDDGREGMHDYIEFVPTGIVNGTIPEDRE
ncbi:MAG: fasciclin domain-containing protein [Bacteroidaceae bacterium]|nr:fasciclin domain-containing protein [Bacteroidaceae bacterium]